LVILCPENARVADAADHYVLIIPLDCGSAANFAFLLSPAGGKGLGWLIFT
jgi:hypothetical protein